MWQWVDLAGLAQIGVNLAKTEKFNITKYSILSNIHLNLLQVYMGRHAKCK
jgi:hypothetical protein